jgi:hypothetical protein
MVTIQEVVSNALQNISFWAVVAFLCSVAVTLVFFGSEPRRRAIHAPSLDLSPRTQTQRWEFDAVTLLQDAYKQVCS